MTFFRTRTELYILRLLKEVRPGRKFRLLKRSLALSAAGLFLLVVLAAITFSGIGTISQVEARSINWTQFDDSGLPAEVVYDARNLAEKLHGSGEVADLYYRQMLRAYTEAAEHDFVIFFNPGGWGTRKLQDSAEWLSIIEGVRGEMERAGYRVAVFNYHRTVDNIHGKLNEIKEVVTGYHVKAEDLSEFVNFLTIHHPGLRVILAGESTGTLICDTAMTWLRENDRVYSIQTGSPFWHKHQFSARTVLVNDNGIVPDSFSQGDLLTIIVSSIKSALGLQEKKDNGAILGVFSAPGHEYWWQNPGVYSQIEMFLENYLGLSPERQSAE